MRLFQRAFVQTQSLGDCLDRGLLTDDALAEHCLGHREAIGRVAEDHVARNPRLLRDHLDNVFRLNDQSLRFVDLDFDCRSVKPANRLVRQVEIADVLWRHLQSRVDGVVGDLHGIVLLETRSQTKQDFPSLSNRGFNYLHEPETSRQCFIVGDVFFVLRKSSWRR